MTRWLWECNFYLYESVIFDQRFFWGIIRYRHLTCCGMIFHFVCFRWDFCYLKGRVIEHIDGHSDIVHKQFHKYWLPWYDESKQNSSLAEYFIGWKYLFSVMDLIWEECNAGVWNQGTCLCIVTGAVKTMALTVSACSQCKLLMVMVICALSIDDCVLLLPQWSFTIRWIMRNVLHERSSCVRRSKVSINLLCNLLQCDLCSLETSSSSIVVCMFFIQWFGWWSHLPTLEWPGSSYVDPKAQFYRAQTCGTSSSWLDSKALVSADGATWSRHYRHKVVTRTGAWWSTFSPSTGSTGAHAGVPVETRTSRSKSSTESQVLYKLHIGHIPLSFPKCSFFFPSLKSLYITLFFVECLFRTLYTVYSTLAFGQCWFLGLRESCVCQLWGSFTRWSRRITCRLPWVQQTSAGWKWQQLCARGLRRTVQCYSMGLSLRRTWRRIKVPLGRVCSGSWLRMSSSMFRKTRRGSWSLMMGNSRLMRKALRTKTRYLKLHMCFCLLFVWMVCRDVGLLTTLLGGLLCWQNEGAHKLSTAATIVKRFQDMKGWSPSPCGWEHLIICLPYPTKSGLIEEMWTDFGSLCNGDYVDWRSTSSNCTFLGTSSMIFPI